MMPTLFVLLLLMARRPKKILLASLLVLLGTAYFSSLSTLDTNFLLKSCAVLLPVQVGGTLYLLYLYWTGKIAGTARHQAKQFANTGQNSPPTSPV